MALLANISFQDGSAGKTPVPRNQWFPTVQRRRYGSNRGKTMIQGTANGGTIFLYGMLSGKPTPFPLAAFGRTIGMFGYTFGELRGTPEWETMKKYIYDRLTDGSFKPKIARTFPFDQTVEAYRYLESNQQIGKVVITL